MAQVIQAAKPPSSDPDAVELLRMMMLIRRFEEKAAEMYARGKIKGFLHLYIGQEAIAAGAIAALRDDDYIVTHYREHGHALARGLEPGRVMAELFGRETGVTGGRGGSMHIIDAAKSFMGGYAIVAGHMPLACGLALAEQHKGTQRLAVCFFGDGAVNEGEFHEALNLASVWKLPVLFVCENNLYGMGTDVRRVSAVIEIYKRVPEAYAMPAMQVDGMDVLAVHEAVYDATERIRRGEGPVFLEMICYRFRGHSMADAEHYRDKEEISVWRNLDPIKQLRTALEANTTLSSERLASMTSEIEEIVNDAAQFADDSPEPVIESLRRHVYKEASDG